MGTHFKFFIVTFFIFILGLSAQTQKEITGFITHFGERLQGVEISVLDNDTRTVTDAKGYYAIIASQGNTLVYTYPGMRTVEVIVEDVTRILNVSLNPEINELNEVVVTEKKLTKREQQEIQWQQGEGIVKGAFGFIDKKSSALAIDFIEEEDILRSFNLIDAVRRVAPSARLVFDEFGFPIGINVSPRFCGFSGCPPAGFDIDGFVTVGTRIPFIPLDQIKRIAVIRSPQFGIYGRFASAGLIVINTKNSFFLKDGENGEPYDYARLRNNIYSSEAKQYQWHNGGKSNYVVALEKTTSGSQAIDLYTEYKNAYQSDEDFHFDTATYFFRKLNDNEKGLMVLQNVTGHFNDNANVLKTAAYLLEDSGFVGEANKVYERILRLRPSYAQSYRDLANSYLSIGDEKRAMAIYARYENHLSPKQELEGSEIDSIVGVETASMITQGKSKFLENFKNLDANSEWPIRVLIEWNNSEAEFDFQLVHPENQYYTWSHTQEKNKDLIQDEKLKGYSSKQFYIDSDSKGNWSANITYFGNKSFKDTYVKATVYYNYATYKEKKEHYVFKLSGKNTNQNLFTMNAPDRAKVSLN